MAKDESRALPLYVQLRDARIAFWQANSLSIPARLVLVALCDYCCLDKKKKRYGMAWPSINTLTTASGLGRSTVIAAIKTLTLAKAIRRVKQATSKTSAVYGFAFFPTLTTGKTEVHSVDPRGTGCGPQGVTVWTPGVQGVDPRVSQCGPNKAIDEAIGRGNGKDTLPLPPHGETQREGVAEPKPAEVEPSRPEVPSQDATPAKAHGLPTTPGLPLGGDVERNGATPATAATPEARQPVPVADAAQRPGVASGTGAGGTPGDRPYRPRFDLQTAQFDDEFKAVVKRVTDCYHAEVGFVNLSGKSTNIEAIGRAMLDDGLTEAQLIQAVKKWGKHLAKTPQDKRMNCARFFREGLHTQMLELPETKHAKFDEAEHLRRKTEQFRKQLAAINGQS